MSNIIIGAPLVDGSHMPFIDEHSSCEATCELIAGDDLRPPPLGVAIMIKTPTGKAVKVWIPNSETGFVSVTIDGETI
jgi:hypothetical protein